MTPKIINLDYVPYTIAALPPATLSLRFAQHTAKRHSLFIHRAPSQSLICSRYLFRPSPGDNKHDKREAGNWATIQTIVDPSLQLQVIIDGVHLPNQPLSDGDEGGARGASAR